MLKKIRVGIAVVVLALITFFFLDFAGILPSGFNWLAKIQLVPALLSLNILVLLALVVTTFLFGRIYCSVICPLGIFQDLVGRISKLFRRKKKRYRYHKAQNILRWSVLILVVVSFLLGFNLLFGLLDPYSAYGRIVATLFKPAYLAGNNLLESIFTSFNSYTFYKMDIAIRGLFVLIVGAVTFLAVGFLAWKYGRLYCNTICPVGTLLGFLSRFSFFKIRFDASSCNQCGLCELKCKGLCLDSKEQTIDYSRCVICFNCMESCRHGALKYAPFTSSKKENTIIVSEPVDDGKRKFLSTLVVTSLTIPAVYAQKKTGIASDVKPFGRNTPLTPPGSISAENLLQHCTSCQLCISKCPTNVLKPAFLEYGLSGMMQPVMSFDKGFCNFNCTVCSNTCPNGAIKPLTVEEKHRTQVGRVVFIKENCIVTNRERSCGACSEHCPTQAVSMVPYKGWITIPSVNPDICIGCGGCEFVCPAPEKAIYVEGNKVHQLAKVVAEEEKEEKEVDGFGF